jgi:hypothetical protein
MNEGTAIKNALMFDPISSAMRNDPYPLYRELRDADPVHYSERFSTWILLRISA